LRRYSLDGLRPNQLSKESRKDWGKWQIETSATWGNAFWGFLSGGLNYQIEHHMFPGRGLHSSTLRLNLSASYGIGGARRGSGARVKPSLRYDYPLIPSNRASRPIRDEER
jgi:hypothetical protein